MIYRVDVLFPVFLFFSLNAIVILQVLDHDRVTKNEIIGRLVIGRDEEGEAESQHWKEIMQNPRKQIAEWHKLTE